MKIERNILLFKLNSFFGNLWPLLALAVVYFQQITGSYAAALGIFSVTTVSQSLSEVPTGVISDKVGRRYTLILYAVFSLFGLFLFSIAGNLTMPTLLFVGAVSRGVADAFESGTGEALLYETMQELGKENEYDLVFSRSKMFGQIGLAAGALIATGVTYFYSLNVLAWVSFGISFFQLFIVLNFVEPGITGKGRRVSSLEHFKNSWNALIKNKKLRYFACIKMFQKACGWTTYSFEGAYFNALIPTWAVSVVRIIKQITGIISYAIAPCFRKLGFLKTLMTSSALMFLIDLTALVLNTFVTPFIMSFVNLFHGVSETAGSALFQKEFTQEQRATMGSIVSLIGALFLAVMYCFIGFVADLYSLYFAMLLLLLLKFLTVFGYYDLLRRFKE
ncbi:MAG: MFS transporter [Alphaproteobacteria bacterium]|nr:MFS transporter [Alphaproteobacteria bacterium]